jgi:hypothetical protein
MTTIPYFYIIQHIITKKYYAGSKYSKDDSDPKTLLKPNGYTTSSPIINKIIEKEGLDSFIIRKIKIFACSHAAYQYETRFLKKINAAYNINFYNCHNNDLRCPSFGTLEYSQLLLDKYNVTNANYVPGVIDKIRNKAFQRYDDTEWRNTKWIRGIEKMKNTMADSEWRKNVAKPRSIKAVQNRNKELAAMRCSETKLSPHWKNTIGKISQEKRNVIRQQKTNRPVVLEIRQICKQYNVKLGSGWSVKDDEFLNNKLIELKHQYDC